jgi:L-rhamnose isomerase/sugar isomerase
MKTLPIPPESILASNAALEAAHQEQYEALAASLNRRGQRLESIVKASARFVLAMPSRAFRIHGGRPDRFPLPGLPENLEEVLTDAAVVHALTAITPSLSLQCPQDLPEDPAAFRRQARRLGLRCEVVISDTQEDVPGRKHSYRHGSLSHTDAAVRRQAIEQHVAGVQAGRALGAQALMVSLADGGCYPGQQHLRRGLDRVIDSLENVYSALPKGCRLLLKHHPIPPASYAAVIPDWGTSLLVAQTLGPQAFCSVDLGQQLPNCNVEQVVARLTSVNRLGAVQFNDSRHADDDLAAGSLKPYQLFLVLNELVDAALDPHVRKSRPPFDPIHMLDGSPSVKDPLEELVVSALEVHRAHTKALLVDREALDHYQQSNDVVMAERVLRTAFDTDVSPILAEVRRRKGAALDPIRAFREAGYRLSQSERRLVA